MEGKNLTFIGLAASAIAILPIFPAQYIIIDELLAIVALILGIMARKKGDRHGGLIILIIAASLIIETLLKDYLLSILTPLM